MNKAEILITVLSLFFCTFVPFVISFLLIRNYNRTSGVKRKTSDVVMYAVCVLCELSILEATLRVLKSNGLIDFVKRLIKFDIYYKDISVLAVAVGVSCVASVFITVISEMIRRRSISTSMPSKRSLASVLALLSAVCIPVLLGLYFEDNQYKNLEITGICRETSEEERSERIKEVVWGEYLITNNSALRIEVNDLWLSTDNEDLCKLSVTGILIEAGETYTVTAAEDDRLDISKDGGSEVILSDNDGKIISKVTVPALKNREWYEKKNGEWQTVQKGRVVDKKVSTPQFSAVGGFYDDAFDLSITAEEGLTIHYTLDGSIPTTESAIYESPLYIYNRSAESNVYKAIKNVTLDYLVNDYTPTYPVDKATVVRAVAIDGEGNISPIVTQTYFVGLDKYKYQDVVSLVSDPKGLFSEETGIYANGKNTDEYLNSLSEEEMKEAIKDWYAFVLATPPNWEQRGSEWERCSEFELFSNGESRLKQPVGIAIQGNHSRTTFTKRFSVYAREEYSGSDFFDEVLVGDTFSHALCLRNDSDLFAMSQFFCADRDLVPVSSRKVVLFLDGEYWADYYLTDKYNFKNFARRFGLLENNIVIIKNGEAPENMDEGRNPFLRIYVPEIEASSDEEFYDKYNDIVDIQSYIDFVCVNHYLSNIDITDVSNCIVWHTAIPQNNDYGDGRWRFISYDMDAVFLNPDFSYKEAFKNNLFVATASHQKPIREWIVWTLLCNNSVFRKQFVLSYTDMVNTTFSEKFVSYVLNDKGFYSDLASEFFKNRPGYAIPQVAKEFGLSGKLGTVTLSSNKDGSPIKLNTVTPELENGMWSGRYFTEYPVTVSANEDGFIRFEVTANGKTTKYTEHEVEIPVTEGGVNIHAVYE